MKVEVTYVTDPASPQGWAAEPQVRRVRAEFGAGVRFTYQMGGRARTVDDPVQLCLELLEAGGRPRRRRPRTLGRGVARGGRGPPGRARDRGRRAAPDAARGGGGARRPRAVGGAETAALCGLAPLRATGELWRLTPEFRARPERLGSGELWHAG